MNAMTFHTRINPAPGDITLEADSEGDFISFSAIWLTTRCVGRICGLWMENREFLLSDLEVFDSVLISKATPLPFKRRANFRRLGIGKKLLRSLVDYAKQNGAARIYGSVVPRDLEENGDLLDWYRREGFTIHDPDEKCLRNAVAMIEMVSAVDGLNQEGHGVAASERLIH